MPPKFVDAGFPLHLQLSNAMGGAPERLEHDRAVLHNLVRRFICKYSHALY
jgi:hypothetical protein